MNNFIFENKTKVYFGKGGVKEYLGSLLGNYGETVMLAYGGGSIKRNGVYDEIMGILNAAGKRIVEFSGIMSNSTYAKVQEGAKLARASAMAENGVLKIGKVTDFQAHQIEHQLGAYTNCNHGASLAVIHPVLYRHIYKSGTARKSVSAGMPSSAKLVGRPISLINEASASIPAAAVSSSLPLGAMPQTFCAQRVNRAVPDL